MKKITLVLAGFLLTAATSFAQDANTSTTKPELSKEEKTKLKQKQDEEMMSAYKEVGLTEDQIKLVKDANTEAWKKSNEIRKDAALTEDAKKEKLKEISTEKNEKIKAIMGADTYKLFSAIRKKQKEAAATTATP